MAKAALAGSARSAVPGARATGKANPSERLEVTVILRRRDHGAFGEGLAAAVRGDRSRRMTHEDFAQAYGAAAEDAELIKQFAARYGLHVVVEDLARRTMKLSGTVAQFSEAFGVQLNTYAHDDGTYRGRVGSILLDDELHGVVEAVLGLDNRPQAKPHFRIRAAEGNGAYTAAAATANLEYTPTELASVYEYPASAGAGECIGIIELGGGFRPADLKKYFAKIGTQEPAVTAVSVDHATNSPGNPKGADGEVMLDIEVAGAIAPGASIVVYFAPNTDAGFLDAVTTAIHDDVHKPSVISISWGGPESSWSQQSLDAFNAAFESAATLGITVCVASGDSGSSDGIAGNNVDFPASSPYALACGGTSLRASGTTIVSETVWNDGAAGGAGGGGVSTVFPAPSWQAGLFSTATSGQREPLTFRGVPDVSGDADPETGYEVIVDGKWTVIGGTSAVAPLWAGLIARLNAINKKPVGLIQPILYAHPEALRDVTQGSNGAYEATPNYDVCTGLGTPIGTAIQAAVTVADSHLAHSVGSS